MKFYASESASVFPLSLVLLIIYSPPYLQTTKYKNRSVLNVCIFTLTGFQVMFVIALHSCCAAQAVVSHVHAFCYFIGPSPGKIFKTKGEKRKLTLGDLVFIADFQPNTSLDFLQLPQETDGLQRGYLCHASVKQVPSLKTHC